VTPLLAQHGRGGWPPRPAGPVLDCPATYRWSRRCQPLLPAAIRPDRRRDGTCSALSRGDTI